MASESIPGAPLSTTNQLLTSGAAVVQDFHPVKSICAHLNAFHVYADEPHRFVEANHYCAHVNDDVRQCLIYDSTAPNARLIGVEYMVTPRLFSTLSSEERKLWHTHVFEVKSGMLIMPQPSTSLLPAIAWEAAEKKEMEQVVKLYGKTYHFWQVDRGDQLPMGQPVLMGSFTGAGQMKEFEKVVGERDERFGSDWRRKKEGREYIAEPLLEDVVDIAWKK
ncbi:DUF1264-domain-containing protein [Atractiella rhizophila]|nr:DUF1264-domain-containing protein [Atractiella rhizophila]